MSIFAGLDVSDKSTHICVVDAEGGVLRRAVVASDPEALAVHGLTTDFLSQHPSFEDVAHQLVEYVKGAEVIIHNAAFDVKFLNAELGRAGLPRFDALCEKVTDSLLFARELFPGKRNSLDALCERFGISNAHRTLHGGHFIQENDPAGFVAAIRDVAAAR